MTDQGKLHRHADGTTHRHFAAGVSVGSQTIPDDDGSGPHEHGTLPLTARPDDVGTTSGRVVQLYSEETAPMIESYAARVTELEAEGLTTSDAQGVAEAEGLDPAEERTVVRPHAFEPGAKGPRGVVCARCQGPREHRAHSAFPIGEEAQDPRTVRSVRIELAYDLDAFGEYPWSAMLYAVDGSVLGDISGPSAYDVLIEAAQAADRFVAESV